MKLEMMWKKEFNQSQDDFLKTYNVISFKR